jgi:hypothetical protein
MEATLTARSQAGRMAAPTISKFPTSSDKRRAMSAHGSVARRDGTSRLGGSLVELRTRVQASPRRPQEAVRWDLAELPNRGVSQDRGSMARVARYPGCNPRSISSFPRRNVPQDPRGRFEDALPTQEPSAPRRTAKELTPPSSRPPKSRGDHVGSRDSVRRWQKGAVSHATAEQIL